jgi:hypothetical protein
MILKLWLGVQIVHRGILGPAIIHERTNSERYMRLILSPFSDHLIEEEKSYWHFMQDNTPEKTASTSVDVFDEVFGEWS